MCVTAPLDREGSRGICRTSVKPGGCVWLYAPGACVFPCHVVTRAAAVLGSAFMGVLYGWQQRESPRLGT